MNSIRPVVVIALLCCCCAGWEMGHADTEIDSETVTSGSAEAPLGDLADYRSWVRSRRGSTPMLDAGVRMNTTQRDFRRWRDRMGRGSNKQTDSKFATQSVTALEEEESESSGGSGLFGSIFGDIAGLSGTKAELRNVRNRMSQLVQPLQNLQQPIESLREPIRDLGDPISKLRDPITEIKQPISDLKQPMSDLRQPLTDLKRPMVDLKEGLEKPLNGLQKPLNDLNMGTRRLSAPLNRMSGELNQLQRPMASIGRPLQQLAPPINRLPEPIQSLSGSVTDLKAEVNGLHSELGSLRQSILDISRNISFSVIAASFVVGASVIISRKVASRQQPTRTVVEQVVENRPIDMAPPEEHSHLSGPGPYDIAPTHAPHMPPLAVAEHLHGHGHGRRDHVVKTVVKTVPLPEGEIEENEPQHQYGSDSPDQRSLAEARRSSEHSPKNGRGRSDLVDRDRYH